MSKSSLCGYSDAYILVKGAMYGSKHGRHRSNI